MKECERTPGSYYIRLQQFQIACQLLGLIHCSWQKLLKLIQYLTKILYIEIAISPALLRHPILTCKYLLWNICDLPCKYGHSLPFSEQAQGSAVCPPISSLGISGLLWLPPLLQSQPVPGRNEEKNYQLEPVGLTGVCIVAVCTCICSCIMSDAQSL